MDDNGPGPESARPLPPEAWELLGRFADEVLETTLALRERVLAVVPRGHETINDVGYTVVLRFGPDGRVAHDFVYVTSFTRHANLGFVAGASLDDPAAVLEGDGAMMRHVKFRSAGDVQQADWLDGYLVAALGQAGLDESIGDGETVVRPKVSKRPRAPR